MNRFLLSIPVLFAASITAAACSSSSSPAGGTGVDSGGGGTANPDCATLAACCPSLGASESMCEMVVAAGGANCTTQLNNAHTAGDCKGTTGVDGGTTGKDSGTTGNHDSGTGNKDTGTTGNPDGSTGGGTCAAPTAPPFGFAPPTGLATPGCTTAQTTQLGQDEVTDGGNFSAVVTEGAPDGSVNACGACLEAAILIPGQPVPAAWGAFEIFAAEPTVGDENEADLVGPVIAQFNLGGCIYAADPTTAGKQCGLDVMALDACGLATCLPLCAVTNGGASNSDFSDLFDCVNTAEEGAACAQYFTAFQNDCGAVHNDAGTGAFDKCASLVDEDEDVPEAGTPTAMTESEYFGLICGGGVDAGF